MPEEFLDFTHRDFRPDHKAEPVVRGVPLEFHGMGPQQAGRLLMKVARKSMGKGKGPGKGGKAIKTISKK